MCKEWPKVKKIVQRNCGHLAKKQHTVWTKFLTKQGSHYPNCKLVIEIVLVILASLRCGRAGLFNHQIATHRQALTHEERVIKRNSTDQD